MRPVFRKLMLALVCWGLLAGVAGHTPARADTGASRVHGSDVIRAMVRHEARRLGVPVPLALAVAHAESDFRPRAESHAGARGVMQVMPATARGEYGIDPDLLWEPRLNVRVGLHFLKRLLVRYGGRVDLALSYYNGGSAVGDGPTARVIPATRSYVRRVRQLERRYRLELYGRTLYGASRGRGANAWTLSQRNN